MENFLGKMAFASRAMKDMKNCISVSLRKYELSVIQGFCGETDGVESFSCPYFVCVDNATSPSQCQ